MKQNLFWIGKCIERPKKTFSVDMHVPTLFFISAVLPCTLYLILHTEINTL